METLLLFKLFSSLGLVFIGFTAKLSNSDGWRPLKKYWIYFVFLGVLSLLYEMYRYLL